MGFPVRLSLRTVPWHRRSPGTRLGNPSGSDVAEIHGEGSIILTNEHFLVIFPLFFANHVKQQNDTEQYQMKNL